MKKKMLLSLSVIATIALLTGCEQPQGTPPATDTQTEADATSDESSESSATEEQSPDDAEADSQANASIEGPQEELLGIDGLPEELKIHHDYLFSEHHEYAGEEGLSQYDTIYTLDKSSETEGTLKVYYIYGSLNYSMSSYQGTLSQNNDGIAFVYDDLTDSTDPETYLFETDGDKVTAVTSSYDASTLGSLAGTYVCPKTDYGPVKLVINSIGQPRITLDSGVTYSGSIILFNDKYDLLVNNEDDGISIDWYVFFSGTTFTYEKYDNDDYTAFEGRYTAFGELGDIEFDVDDKGNASSIIEIDGQLIHMTGYIYIYESSITGMYLSSDEGYSLDVQIVDIGGTDGLNYSGTLSKPLSAG